MEILSSVSRPIYFSLTYPMTIIVISVTTQSTISFWMIHCTDVVYILSFGDTLHMKRLKRFSMISTLEHVAVIFLGWLQPIKSSVLGISSPWSSNIVMRQLRNSHPAIAFIPKSAPNLLLYTPSFQLALFPNGVLILCIVRRPHSRGMVTSSEPWIISKNGMRKGLHMQRMVRLLPSFYLTMW